MKALTIWQPWADAIRCGAKRFETRSYATRYRGELAIHASKHEPSCVMEHVAVSEAAQAIESSGLRSGLTHARGAIIAVADLVRVWEPDALGINQGPLSQTEHDLGDFSAGRWAWELKCIRPISPVPCKGAQGLWTVPADVEQLVRVQLTERTRTR